MKTIEMSEPIDAYTESSYVHPETAAAQAARDIKEQAELRTKNPHLMIGHGPVIAAKNLRIELKRAFAGVKFSVTSRSFANGDDINIRWIEGPTTKQVEEISDRYSGGEFDGMTDSYNYSRSNFGACFGTSKYISATRTMTEKLFTKTLIKLTDEYGIKDLPTFEEYIQGEAYKVSPFENDPWRSDWWSWQVLIGRTSEEIDLT